MALLFGDTRENKKVRVPSSVLPKDRNKTRIIRKSITKFLFAHTILILNLKCEDDV